MANIKTGEESCILCFKNIKFNNLDYKDSEQLHDDSNSKRVLFECCRNLLLGVEIKCPFNWSSVLSNDSCLFFCQNCLQLSNKLWVTEQKLNEVKRDLDKIIEDFSSEILQSRLSVISERVNSPEDINDDSLVDSLEFPDDQLEDQEDSLSMSVPPPLNSTEVKIEEVFYEHFEDRRGKDQPFASCGEGFNELFSLLDTYSVKQPIKNEMEENLMECEKMRDVPLNRKLLRVSLERLRISKSGKVVLPSSSGRRLRNRSIAAIEVKPPAITSKVKKECLKRALLTSCSEIKSNNETSNTQKKAVTRSPRKRRKLGDDEKRRLRHRKLMKTCRECGQKVYKVRGLRSHTLHMHFRILEDKSPTNFQCSSCELSFTTEVFMKAHYRFVHKGKSHPYECELCKREFMFLSFFERHKTEIHIKEGIEACGECESKFCDVETLTLHKEVVHEKNPKPFNCPDCENTFSAQKYLTSHRERMHSGSHYECEVCNKIFHTSKGIVDHQRLKHSEELKLEPFKCELCPTSYFKTMYQVKRHKIEVHGETFEFNCTQCKNGFHRQQSLENHVKKFHTTEKKLPCPKCGKLFRLQISRRSHIREFHGAYECKCPICSKMFKGKGTLQIHIKNVHSESENRVCPYCPTTFKNLKNLDQHLKTKHEEPAKAVVKDIPCPHCPMMFSDQSFLLNHIRKKHNGEDSMHN